MLIRSETFFKWLLYGLAALVCCAVQGLALQRLVLFGVFPFLYPAVAAVLSTLEGPVAGTAFSLVLGIFCDLALPGPIPCLYTLIFPLAGLVSALIAQGWIKAGPLCALTASAFALVLTDLFQALVLVMQRRDGVLPFALELTAKETALTLPFVIPVFLLMRAVYRRCHRYD